METDDLGLRLVELRGRNLELVERRILKRQSQAGIKLGQMPVAERRDYPLDEDLVSMLGLLPRALAPMRSQDNCRRLPPVLEPWGARKRRAGSAAPCTSSIRNES